MDASSADTIYFYSTRKQWREFSNFAQFAFELKGKRWPTSEHYYQAMKFEGQPYEEVIRAAPNGSTAAKLGRRKKPIVGQTTCTIRADWEQVKESVMRAALRAKFTSHPELRRLLLSTGTARLVEHTRNDKYWADGGDGSGQNRLGALLMELREELKKET